MPSSNSFPASERSAWNFSVSSVFLAAASRAEQPKCVGEGGICGLILRGKPRKIDRLVKALHITLKYSAVLPHI